MPSLSIEIKDTATPAISRVREFLGSDIAAEMIGAAGRKVVRQNFQSLNESRANHLGGPRTNYYSSARQATSYRTEGDAVVISVTQVGLPLHYYGGTVTAGKSTSPVTGRQTKYLAIPVAAESYAKRPSDFDDLVLLWGRNGPYALARGTEQQVTTEREGSRKKVVAGEPLFILKESVTLDPDPSVLPPMSEVGDEVAKVLSGAIRRRFGGGSVSVEEET